MKQFFEGLLELQQLTRSQPLGAVDLNDIIRLVEGPDKEFRPDPSETSQR